MKIHIRPGCPENKSIRRTWSINDGVTVLASGRMIGTLKEVRHYASTRIPRGSGMFDYSTGVRRIAR